MKKTLSSKNKIISTKEKKMEDIHYKIFVGFIIANLVNYMFFEPTIFGDNYKYVIYVFWIPTLLGLLITARYYIFNEIWKDIFKALKEESHFKKNYVPILILLCNFVFSYLIFGFSASVIWNYVNEAKNNPIETFYLPINKFSRTTGKGGGNRVIFNFKGNSETIKTNDETIKPYLDKLPKDYQLILKVRKGIWNYYIFEDFELIKK